MSRLKTYVDSALDSTKRSAWRALAKGDDLVRFSRILPNRNHAVLMFHSVNDSVGNGDERFLSADRFRRTLELLADEFAIVDLPAVLADRSEGPRRIALTFDDGYENFYTEAYPVLREFDVPATCFVIADRIGGTTEEGVPYLSTSQIRTLVNDDRMTIGNHTRTHRDLSAVTDERRLREEIVGAKERLETTFDIEVDRFCFPYGGHSPRSVSIVEDSHRFAVAGAGLVSRDTSPACIPRIDGSQPEELVRWELTELSDRFR